MELSNGSNEASAPGKKESVQWLANLGPGGKIEARNDHGKLIDASPSEQDVNPQIMAITTLGTFFELVGRVVCVDWHRNLASHVR